MIDRAKQVWWLGGSGPPLALAPGKYAGYDPGMWLTGYAPQQFATPYAEWGAKLTLFLCNEANIARAETASELGRPAAQALAQPLLGHFGDDAQGLPFRQLVGHMLKHVMEARGWVLDQTEVRIPNGILFTRAARYRKVGAPAPLARPISTDPTSYFFDYWRRRYEVAATLPSTFGQIGDELTPDQHILIGSHLEALSNRWAKLMGLQLLGKARMAEFLAHHGGHPCFHRVSGPFLLRTALEHEVKARIKNPGYVSPHVEPIRRASPVEPTGALVCKWDEDRTLHDLQADNTLRNVPRDWLETNRYGGQLYVGHRCSWSHESGEGHITDRSISPLWNEPHYEHHNDARVLVLPGDFLLRTLEHAISSFENYCKQNNRIPT